MTDEKPPIPKGYWQDARGALVPESKIKPIDKLRTLVTTTLCEQAKVLNATMCGTKLEAARMIDEFVEQSLSEYGVQHGGKKGNITLVSFDGRYKVVRQVSENLVFDERLQAAKALIDECIHAWAKGSNANIKVLVNDAFQVDREGKISTGRVLSLRRLDIKDETWTRAMAALSDSINVSSSKSYVRFYERDDETGEYMPISLDMASL